MTRLSKDYRVMADPKKWREFWLPLNARLDSIMEETKTNRYSKHFFGQRHLKSLVLFQMTDGRSLEDLHQALTEDLRFQVFTHCPPISKSQFSRANAKRPVEAFHQVLVSLINQLPSEKKLPKSLKSLIQQTSIFDGTSFTLNPSHSPWAIYRHQFRQPDAGLRMTLRLRLNTQAPDRVFIHSHRDNSANYFTECIDFNKKGYLYLFDREFNHHQTLQRIAGSKNFFITRMKNDISYEVLKDYAAPKRFRHGLKIVKDQSVLLGKKTKHRIPTPLRRIEAMDNDGHLLVFLTNLFHFAASTIASLYRLRWQIELFFKWVKQHLKIKHFFAYSMNGILLQIYSALILYLLLALFKSLHHLTMSLFNISRKLRRHLSVVSPVFVIKYQKLKSLESGLSMPPQRLMSLPCF